MTRVINLKIYLHNHFYALEYFLQINESFSVATGARFKIYGNVIHLEIQQAKLSEGQIDSTTLNWKTSSNCNSPRKVTSNFVRRSYSCLKLILEDMILPENAVLTGILFMILFRVNNDSNKNFL